MRLFEVCVDNIKSIRNLIQGGADRIELCSALSEGGLTPSVGFLQIARRLTPQTIPIFCMIRPRGGNFVYDDDEISIMENDIKILKENGADGFVFGLLTKDDNIDIDNCKQLLNVANPLPVTFHRAFDQVSAPFEGLETIIQLGFRRLLTSGQAETADAGIVVISRLVAQSNGRITIIPGSGVNPDNLLTILQSAPVCEFHGSAKASDTDECGIPVTSTTIVRAMKDISKQI